MINADYHSNLRHSDVVVLLIVNNCHGADLLASSIEIDMPYILVLSLDAIRTTRLGDFNQYANDYREALNQLGVEAISNLLHKSR